MSLAVDDYPAVGPMKSQVTEHPPKNAWKGGSRSICDISQDMLHGCIRTGCFVLSHLVYCLGKDVYKKSISRKTHSFCEWLNNPQNKNHLKLDSRGTPSPSPAASH
jgi:hypothetical protein